MRYQFILYFVLLVGLSGCDLPAPIEPVQKNDSTSTVTSTQLIEYTSSTVTIKISGSLPQSGTNQLNTIYFFSNQSCSGTSLVQSVAQTFFNSGVTLSLPITNTSSVSGAAVSLSFPIYFKTNTLSGCYFLANYDFTNTPVSAPKFNRTEPTSPSSTNYSPLFFVDALKNSTVRIYRNMSCAQSDLISEKSATELNQTGVLLNLSPNTIQSLYARTIDPFGAESNCELMTQYVHSDRLPDPPLFTQVSPLSPSRLVSTPVIKGTVSGTIDRVRLFRDASCTQNIGQGTSADFVSNGLQVNVLANQTTRIYAQTLNNLGIPSICQFMTEYIYDTLAPQAPVFSFTTPDSPTSATTQPKVYGFSSADTTEIWFYDDPSCSAVKPIGSGSKYDFENGVGIQIFLQENKINSIYAKAKDLAGNFSNCTFMSYFKHNNIPPDPPLLTDYSPISPNNITAYPKLFGLTSTTTDQVYFFDNDTCTQSIGHGSANDFLKTGLVIATHNIANSQNITNVYAYAIDAEKNKSDCVPLLTYEYSNAVAVAPSFSRFLPSSPNNVSVNPTLFGRADINTVKVSLYSSATCDVGSLLTTVSKSTFQIQGVLLSMNANQKTTIYAQATDKYTNLSDCVSLADYVHDTMSPRAPGYTSIFPRSPTSSTTLPLIKGLAVLNDVFKLTQIKKINFYSDLTCVVAIGQGLIGDFVSNGVQANILYNYNNQIYAQTQDEAGNLSLCTFMTAFKQSQVQPGIPQLTAFTPGSPSFSMQTVVQGQIKATNSIFSVARINFYKDSLCLQSLTNASPQDFTNIGVNLLVDNNVTTQIYAQTADVVDNRSGCTLLGPFVHYDSGPANLVLLQNSNGSVSLQWSVDAISRPYPTYTVLRSTQSGGPYSVIAWDLRSSYFTDNNVVNGRKYYYTVYASNSTGRSKYSTEKNITVSSSTVSDPIALKAQAQNQTVALTWSANFPNQNVYYKVLRSIQPGGPYTLIKDRLSSSFFDDVSVVNNSIYYYRVIAVNISGEGFQSNEVSASPQNISTSAPVLQMALIPQSGACSNQRAVYLKWTPVYPAVGYIIKRGYVSSAALDTLITSYNSNLSEFYDCNPDADTASYPTGRNVYYSVQAIWGAGSQTIYSTESNRTSFHNHDPLILNLYTGSNKNYLVFNQTVLNGAVYQIWRNSSPLIFDYNVDAVTQGFVQIATDYNQNLYVDSSITAGSAYQYMVIPYFNGVAGWPTALAQGQTRLSQNIGIDSFSITSAPNGSPRLNWSTPSEYNYFNVQRKKSTDSGFSTINNSILSANFYLDSSLPQNGELYNYQIQSVFGGDINNQSSVVNYRYGVTNLTGSVSATTNILNWAPVPNVSRYDLYRATQSSTGYALIQSLAPSAAPTFQNSLTSPTGFEVVSGQSYFYKVLPVFADGTTGLMTSEVSLTPASTSATAVTGLTVTGVNSNSVDLAWGKLNGNTTYQIFRSNSFSGPFSQVASSTATSLTVGSLNTNQNYFFKVASFGCKLNCFSNTVSATPHSLTFANQTPVAAAKGSTVDIQFQSDFSGTSGYNIWRTDDGGASFTKINTVLLPTSTTVFNDATTVSGRVYQYKVEATFTDYTLQTSLSNYIKSNYYPQSPGQMTIVSLDNSSVNLTWDPIPLATEYIISWGTSSGNYSQNLSFTTRTATISGLSSGVNYYFVIRSKYGNNLALSVSNELQVIPHNKMAAPTVVFEASGFRISWLNQANVLDYDLYRSMNGYDFQLIQNHISGLSYLDTSSLSVNANYFYRVQPRHNSGQKLQYSDLSNAVNLIAPLPPSGLIGFIDSIATNQVFLSWTFALSDTNSSISSYRIYRRNLGLTNDTLIGTVNSGLNSYVDTSMASNQSYTYYIKSVNVIGVESSSSNLVNLKTTSAATNLTVNSINRQMSLNWQISGPAVSVYKIYRSENATGAFGYLGQTAATSYVDQQIENGRVYYYKVQGLYADQSNSIFSNTVSATALRTMDLSHVVELADQPLISRTTDTTYDQTLTEIDTSYFDGNVSYSFEVVAQNVSTNTGTIELINDQMQIQATVLVPGNQNQYKRLRSSSFSLSGVQKLKVRIRSTSNLSDIKLGSVKLIIKQLGATQTRVYVPLLSSNQSSQGRIDQSDAVEFSQSKNWIVLKNSSVYVKNNRFLKNITNFSSYSLSVNALSLNSLGMFALYNLTKNQTVDTSTIQVDNNTLQSIESTFTEGDLGFDSSDDNSQYALSYKCFDLCDNGPSLIFKAGLWIQLKNITAIETYNRVALTENIMNTNTLIDNSVQFPDGSLLANSQYFFRVNGFANDANNLFDVDLIDIGSNDLNIGVTNVASHLASTNGQQVLQSYTSSSVSLSPASRYVININQVTNFSLNSAFIIQQLEP